MATRKVLYLDTTGALRQLASPDSIQVYGLDAGGVKITSVGTPTANSTDAATTAYVDAKVAQATGASAASTSALGTVKTLSDPVDVNNPTVPVVDGSGIATANGLTTIGASTLTLTANVPASESTGFVFNNTTTMTNGTLVSFQNGGVEVGSIEPSGASFGGVSLGTSAGVSTIAGTRTTLYSNEDITIHSGLTDTVAPVTAISIQTGNFIVAGSKLLSLSSSTTERFYIDKNGTGFFYGGLTVNGSKIVNVGDPVSPQDAATKNYVDTIFTGIDWKVSCRVATTASIADLSNASVTIDGVTLVQGDRVLVKDSASPDGIAAVSAARNGIYVVGVVVTGSAPFTRATDADSGTKLSGGSAVFVTEGSTNADCGWLLVTNDTIVLNTTNLTFSKFTTSAAPGPATTGSAGLTQIYTTSYSPSSPVVPVVDASGVVAATGMLNPSAALVSIKGSVADGAAAVGVALDNSISLSISGAKIVSFRNNGVEKAYIDKDGGLYSLGSVFAGAGGGLFFGRGLQYNSGPVGIYANDTTKIVSFQAFPGSVWTEKASIDNTGLGYFAGGAKIGPHAQSIYSDATYSLRTTIGRFDTSVMSAVGYFTTLSNTNAGSTVGMSYNPYYTASAASIAHVFNTAMSSGVTIAGAKLASFQAYNTEKVYIDKDGGVQITGVGAAASALSIPSGSYLLFDGAAGTRYLSWNGASLGFNGTFSSSALAVGSTSGVYPGGTMSLSLRGRVADGATAIGVKVGNINALVTAGAKVVSFYSDDLATEVAYIDKDGNSYFANTVQAASRVIVGSTGVQGAVNLPLVLDGRVADGATAIGVKIGNINTLTTAGAKIASFYSDNNATERAYIDRLGGITSNSSITAGSSFIAGIGGNNTTYGQGALTVNGAGGGFTLTSAAADGATAVGLTTNNTASLVTAGAKLVSIKNAGVEKASIDKDGVIRGAQLTISGGGTYQAGSIYSDGNWGMIFYSRVAAPTYAQFMWADGSGNNLMNLTNTGRMVLGSPTTGVEALGMLHLKATQADSASSVALYVDTTTAWANAAAKLVSLRNNATEKAYVTKDGSIVASGTGAYLWAQNYVQASGYMISPYYTGTAGSFARVAGTYVDGSAAVGVVLDNLNTLSNVASKLVSFRNNTQEKLYVDYAGAVRAPSVLMLYAGAAQYVSIGVGSTEVIQAQTGITSLTSNIVSLSGYLTAAGVNPVTIKGYGSTAIGTVIDTVNATTANLLSIRNAGVDQVTVDANGSISASSIELGGISVYAGFNDRASSTLSFVNGTRIFTITPSGSFTFWANNVKYTKSVAQNVTIPATVGLHFIYFNASGTLVSSTTPWDVSSDQIAPVATVYWDGTQGVVGEERHSAFRSRNAHAYLHATRGTAYESGLTGTFTDSTLSVATGVIWDEDIKLDLTGAFTSCRLWYRTTGGTVMTFTNASATPYPLNVGTIQYDNAGVLTNVPNNSYVVMWVYGTDYIDYPIAVVVGQSTYNNITGARADTQPVIPNISIREWKLLYSVTYQNSGGTPTYIEQVDYRNSSSLPNASVTSMPAASVTFTPTGTIASTNVQAAIEELDSEKLSLTGGTLSGTLNLGNGTMSGVGSGLTLVSDQAGGATGNDFAFNTNVNRTAGYLFIVKNNGVDNFSINSAGVSIAGSLSVGGNLSVTGTETIVGTTTFSSNIAMGPVGPATSGVTTQNSIDLTTQYSYWNGSSSATTQGYSLRTSPTSAAAGVGDLVFLDFGATERLRLKAGTGELVFAAAANTDAIQLVNNARIHLGSGANAYLYSDGTNIYTPAAMYAVNGLYTSSGNINAATGSITAGGAIGNLALTLNTNGTLTSVGNLGIRAANGSGASIGTANGYGLTLEGNAAYMQFMSFAPAASTATYPSMKFPFGVAPTTPADGDMWADAAGLYYRKAGATLDLTTNLVGSYLPLTGGSVSGAITSTVVSGQAAINLVQGALLNLGGPYSLYGTASHALYTTGTINAVGGLYGSVAYLTSGVTQANANSSLTISGTKTNITSPAVIVDNVSTMGAGGKVLSIRNGGAEKAYFDDAGYLTLGPTGSGWLYAAKVVGSAGYQLSMESNFSSAVISSPIGYPLVLFRRGGVGGNTALQVEEDGGLSKLQYGGTTTVPFTLKGSATDSASATSVVIDNSVSLTTVGAKLVSIKNAGVEKASIDYSGAFRTTSIEQTPMTVVGYTDDVGVIRGSWVKVAGYGNYTGTIPTYDGRPAVGFNFCQDGGSGSDQRRLSGIVEGRYDGGAGAINHGDLVKVITYGPSSQWFSCTNLPNVGDYVYGFGDGSTYAGPVPSTDYAGTDADKILVGTVIETRIAPSNAFRIFVNCLPKFDMTWGEAHYYAKGGSNISDPGNNLFLQGNVETGGAVVTIFSSFEAVSTKLLSIQNNSIEKAYFDKDGILSVTGLLGSPVTIANISATGTPSATTYLRGDGSWQTVTSGITAPYTLDGAGTGTIPLTINAPTGQSANLQEWQVNGVSKAYIALNGDIYAGGGGGSGTVRGQIFGPNTSGQSAWLTGNLATSSTGIAVKITNASALGATGSIAAFYSDGGVTVKAAILANSTLQIDSIQPNTAGGLLTLNSKLVAASASTDFVLNSNAATRTAGLLFDLQNNGSTRLKVDYAGIATFAGGISSQVASGSDALTVLAGAKVKLGNIQLTGHGAGNQSLLITRTTATPYAFTNSTNGGDIVLNVGAVDTPALKFVYGANATMGIDVVSGLMRFVNQLDETGGYVGATMSTGGVFWATQLHSSVYDVAPAAGAMSIGATNATSLTLGKAGVAVNVPGTLQAGPSAAATGNAFDCLVVKNGTTAAGWNTRAIVGGDTGAFLMGQYRATTGGTISGGNLPAAGPYLWLGAHNAALSAWSDFYINPDGGMKLYLGAHGTWATGGPGILTLDNATGFAGIGTGAMVAPGYTLHVRSRTADGASAVATVIDTVSAWATAGAKLMSWRTGGSEKAYIDYAGNVTVGGTGIGTVNAALVGPSTSGNTATVRGNVAAATATGAVILDNVATLTTAGAKIVSIRHGGSEKASFDKDGRLTSLYIQSTGYSASWGATSTTSTGAYNAIMGTASSATWLLSGTSGGVFRAGIQALDSDGTLRFYQGANYFSFTGGTLTATTFSGNLTGNVTGNTSGSSGSCTGNAATATTASNINVTDDTTTNSTHYLTISATASGGNLLKVSSTKLTYNPSTGALTATGPVATGNLTVTGAITATGNITAYYSDARLKSNIRVIGGALDRLCALRGVQWEWNSDECAKAGFTPDSPADVGVIAQEVQSILPTAVGKAANPEYLAIKTSSQALIALLIEAVKELKAEVDMLKAGRA